ncbi:MAG: hypothetical protein ACXVFM_10860, partial [Solirubrobacteraceae bacterium]
ASVQNATTCTFKSTPTLTGLPVDKACGSGAATANVTLPANTTSKAKTYTFGLTATGTGRNAQATPITVTVQPRGAPIDTTPPGPVTALVATAATNGMSLSWTNPRDPDLSAIVVRRALGTTAPSTVTDGDPVGTITPPAAQLNDPVPSDGSTYSYSIFARDSSGNYSGRTSVTVASLDRTPPGPVTTLAASAAAASVHLSWTNPADADFAAFSTSDRRPTATASSAVFTGSRAATSRVTTGVASSPPCCATAASPRKRSTRRATSSSG